MSKLIVIEGTDCSGKETQSKLLFERLKKENKKVVRFSFPMYETSTGKIIGGPYLGKKSISDSWFKDPVSVDPKVASLYYAADRKFNINIINEYLENDYIVLLDRYVTSNMGHQASKIKDEEKRLELYKWLEKLEYDLLELPRPDKTIFLHMPYVFSIKLSQNRDELDAHENDENHLRNAEIAYIEIAELYNFNVISCIENGELKTIEAISEEVYRSIL